MKSLFISILMLITVSVNAQITIYPLAELQEGGSTAAIMVQNEVVTDIYITANSQALIISFYQEEVSLQDSTHWFSTEPMLYMWKSERQPLCNRDYRTIYTDHRIEFKYFGTIILNNFTKPEELYTYETHR